MKLDDTNSGDAKTGQGGSPANLPPGPPRGGVGPSSATPEPRPTGDGTEHSRRPTRRIGFALGALAVGAILVAAGFGLAQLVDQDTLDTAGGAGAALERPDANASAGPADDAAPEASEPSLPSPLLDRLPLDRDELERLLEEFGELLGEDFAIPFDRLPLPEDVPELDGLPGLDQLPSLDKVLPLLDQLPVDRAELERLFEEFRQALPEDFSFEGELRVPDELPFLDELPLEGSELEEWLEQLRDRLGERFSPGS